MKTNTAPKQRFKILEFTNPRTRGASWRVTGTRLSGERVRENFADPEKARLRHIALETEFLSKPSEKALRLTSLTENQVGVAEACFRLVDEDDDLLTAVRFWIAHGRGKAPGASPRLDEALTEYKAALEKDASIRELTRYANGSRAARFVNASPNIRVAEVTPEIVESYLDKLTGTPRTKINMKGGVSRFLEWCVERPRRWLTVNPCRSVKVKIGDAAPPVILNVDDCKRVVRTAENFKKGKLVPYLALTMFAGLRPWEARRMQWSQVNFDDGEIRIEGVQSKIKRARAFKMDATTAAWLIACKNRPFLPVNFDNDWHAMLKSVGFGTDKDANERPWVKDVLRHTAISHSFRSSGSYGLTAERFGNSEGVIKRHYQGRVSSDETKAFYAIMPKGKATK